MKLFQLAALALSVSAALPALAQTNCSGTPLTAAEISALVTGNTVCGRPGASYPGSTSDRFQEAHLGSGELWDYKRGPGHAVDPRKQVGTWSTAGGPAPSAGTITHQYGPSAIFTWRVFGPTTNFAGSSVYSFCTDSAAEHVRAFIVTGSNTPCGSYP